MQPLTRTLKLIYRKVDLSQTPNPTTQTVPGSQDNSSSSDRSNDEEQAKGEVNSSSKEACSSKRKGNTHAVGILGILICGGNTTPITSVRECMPAGISNITRITSVSGIKCFIQFCKTQHVRLQPATGCTATYLATALHKQGMAPATIYTCLYLSAVSACHRENRFTEPSKDNPLLTLVRHGVTGSSKRLPNQPNPSLMPSSGTSSATSNPISTYGILNMQCCQQHSAWHSTA